MSQRARLLVHAFGEVTADAWNWKRMRLETSPLHLLAHRPEIQFARARYFSTLREEIRCRVVTGIGISAKTTANRGSVSDRCNRTISLEPGLDTLSVVNYHSATSVIEGNVIAQSARDAPCTRHHSGSDPSYLLYTRHTVFLLLRPPLRRPAATALNLGNPRLVIRRY